MNPEAKALALDLIAALNPTNTPETTEQLTKAAVARHPELVAPWGTPPRLAYDLGRALSLLRHHLHGNRNHTVEHLTRELLDDYQEAMTGDR